MEYTDIQLKKPKSGNKTTSLMTQGVDPLTEGSTPELSLEEPKGLSRMELGAANINNKISAGVNPFTKNKAKSASAGSVAATIGTSVGAGAAAGAAAGGVGAIPGAIIGLIAGVGKVLLGNRAAKKAAREANRLAEEQQRLDIKNYNVNMANYKATSAANEYQALSKTNSFTMRSAKNGGKIINNNMKKILKFEKGGTLSNKDLVNNFISARSPAKPILSPENIVNAEDAKAIFNHLVPKAAAIIRSKNPGVYERFTRDMSNPNLSRAQRYQYVDSIIGANKNVDMSVPPEQVLSSQELQRFLPARNIVGTRAATMNDKQIYSDNGQKTTLMGKGQDKYNIGYRHLVDALYTPDKHIIEGDGMHVEGQKVYNPVTDTVEFKPNYEKSTVPERVPYYILHPETYKPNPGTSISESLKKPKLNGK